MKDKKLNVVLTGIADMTIPVKKIGKAYYGAASCVVTLGGAEIPAYAVVCKGSRNTKKWVSTYADCAMRLIEWGLSVDQTQKILDGVALEADRIELKQYVNGNLQ